MYVYVVEVVEMGMDFREDAKRTTEDGRRQ